MAIGFHEHMRNIEIGDELAWRVERFSEAMEINPTKKNIARLEKAVQELNDFTAWIEEYYGVELDKKAA